MSQPPCDLDAEAAVLCTLLLDPECFDLVASLVGPVDCYADANRQIFEAIVAVRATGQPADEITVCGRLRDTDRLDQVGGVPYLAQIANATPAVANVEAHARIVADRARLRRAIAVVQTWTAASYEPVENVQAHLDDLETQLHDITRASRSSAGTYAHEHFGAVVEQAQKAANSEGVSGVSTGLQSIDKILTGLHDGDLYIVASRPGMGKTSLALGMAASMGLQADSVAAVFSLEMPKEQLAARLLTVDSRVDLSKLRSGDMRPEDWARLTDSAERLTPSNVWLDETAGITLLEFRGKLRQLQAECARNGKRVVAVFIDYLQLMKGPPGSAKSGREQEISEISRGLKAAAKEFKIPIVALAQLSRKCEERNDKRPILSDLRDSGAIEQDADAVLFLYRDEYYNSDSPDAGIAEVGIAKQRNGPTGIVRLRFIPTFTRFDDLAVDEWGPPGGDYDDFDQEQQPEPGRDNYRGD